MITLLNTGVATLVVVELPENAYDFRITRLSNIFYYVCNVSGHIQPTTIHLPPGNWIILGWSDDLNPDQLSEIGMLDNKNLSLFLLSNGITERKYLLKQVI